MKTSNLRIFVAVLVFPLLVSCVAKYEFNGRVELDDGVPNQVNNKSLQCGTGVLEFDYTVGPADALGILEIENKGACDLKIELARRLPNSASAERMPGDTVQRGNRKINVFNIADADRRGQLHVRISCLEAESDEGCLFYYKFSSAANISTNLTFSRDE